MSSQWSQGLVPPPDGVQANFIDPPNQLDTNIAVHASFLTVSTFAVVMRVYTRIQISGVKLGVDDCQFLSIWQALVIANTTTTDLAMFSYVIYPSADDMIHQLS